ncbi:uncharacterized protein SCHCODRAFT_02643811 [Schizophyllum commune H4-8]|uniref:uncharacterized protein n=1 Tax=Schizophyllum commune (strain H4-8 / FGSC 9210) TaxID=578458 RepID=UPI00215E1511|nr:uncharacterized protein SCHCODRAFT_02643811 [Schizophyllum commune H4-8]KAI5885573.1 hypothetical protein SCHCODRAFT_02643811 [Schizophyllum commune H4-8]
MTALIYELRTRGELSGCLDTRKGRKMRSPTSSRSQHMRCAPAMGRIPSKNASHRFRMQSQSCDGRDLRSDLSFRNVELLCMQNSTSSPPFLAHPPKNTSRTKSMRISILSRFCISTPVLRAADRVP